MACLEALILIRLAGLVVLLHPLDGELADAGHALRGPVHIDVQAQLPAQLPHQLQPSLPLHRKYMLWSANMFGDTHGSRLLNGQLCRQQCMADKEVP